MSLIYSTQSKKDNSVCQKCPLFDGDLVLPVTSSHASHVALVQECPTDEDYLRGEPFIGERADMVEDWLSGRKEGLFGYELAKTHKLLAVKCSPPPGKKPGVAATVACRNHLETDIENLTEKGLRVVVPLGATATRSFFPVSLFGAVRGQPRVVEFGSVKIKVFPTLSPAHVLARRGEESLVRKDFKNIIRVARGLSLDDYFESQKTKVTVLSSPSDVKEFLTVQIYNHKVISIDLETTGYDYEKDAVVNNALNYLSGRIIAISISVSSGYGYVIPVLGANAKKIWSDSFISEMASWIKKAMEFPKVLWVLQNAQFDLLYLSYNYGVDISKVRYVDVMLMSHLLWEEAPKDLKTMATVHTDMGGYESILRKK